MVDEPLLYFQRNANSHFRIIFFMKQYSKQWKLCWGKLWISPGNLKIKDIKSYIIRWNDEMVAILNYCRDKMEQSIRVIVIENVYEFKFTVRHSRFALFWQSNSMYTTYYLNNCNILILHSNFHPHRLTGLKLIYS